MRADSAPCRHGRRGTVANTADDRASSSHSGGLEKRDEAILAFERQWWKHAGAKEQAIREEFGLSAARYYQLLGVLIESPTALQHDPMLVKRLQRLRDARVAARSTRKRPRCRRMARKWDMPSPQITEACSTPRILQTWNAGSTTRTGSICLQAK